MTLLVVVGLLFATVASAAPTLCTAPSITGLRESLAGYANLTFAAAPLTLDGGAFTNWER